MSSDASSNQPRASLSLIAMLLRDPLERRSVPEGLADDSLQPPQARDVHDGVAPTDDEMVAARRLRDPMQGDVPVAPPPLTQGTFLSRDAKHVFVCRRVDSLLASHRGWSMR